MPTSLSVTEVLARFRQGIGKLLQDDDYLLVHDVSERAITHKLGVYLQPLFPEWDVDCEYNRDMAGSKRIQMLQQSHRNIAPDVIVHKRGLNTHNLLTVEAKKHNCKPEKIQFDHAKIEAYAKENLNYHIGIYVTFSTGKTAVGKCSFKAYYAGKWHKEENVSPNYLSVEI